MDQEIQQELHVLRTIQGVDGPAFKKLQRQELEQVR